MSNHTTPDLGALPLCRDRVSSRPRPKWLAAHSVPCPLSPIPCSPFPLFPARCSLVPVPCPIKTASKPRSFAPFRTKIALFSSSFHQITSNYNSTFSTFPSPSRSSSRILHARPPAHRRNPLASPPREPALPKITPLWRTLVFKDRSTPNPAQTRAPERQSVPQNS